MNNKKQIWQFPWQFKESLIILSTAIIISFILDYFAKNSTVIKPVFPYNIYIILTIFIFETLIYIFFKKTNFIKWLQSSFLAISTIAWLFILVIIMGIFEQNSQKEGLIHDLHLNNIVYSKPFIIIELALFTNLLIVIYSKISEFSIRNFSFIINHLGILIIIISLSFGAGDIEKYTIQIDKQNYIWGASNKEKTTELAFALKLKDFHIEMFPAKIAIVENKTDNIIDGNSNIISANKDSVIKFNEYKISLQKYYNNGVFINNNFYSVNDQGAAPTAMLSIETNNTIDTCYVSCGSYMYPSKFYSINSDYTLVMLEPEPKLFKSDIKVTYKNSKTENISIEVNKPVNIYGWDIYQTDYNKDMGRWSEYSVIEIVKDPWLNIVYIGIFMMIIGAIGIIFLGKKSN